MRIHFGIKYGRSITWPERCSWCGAGIDKWQKYQKKSSYESQYRIFWWNILSRVQTIYYPLCKKHNIIAHLLRPSRLLWESILVFFLFLVVVDIIDIKTQWLYLLFLLPLAGYFYYKKHGLIIHNVGEKHLELSLPDGKYAEEFGLLNNCNNIKGHLLTQD